VPLQRNIAVGQIRPSSRGVRIGARSTPGGSRVTSNGGQSYTTIVAHFITGRVNH
jgi:hypothetical protein